MFDEALAFVVIVDPGKTTISNDGATIMSLLDVVHPAAHTLVDIAKSQDAEVSFHVLPRSIRMFTQPVCGQTSSKAPQNIWHKKHQFQGSSHACISSWKEISLQSNRT